MILSLGMHFKLASINRTKDAMYGKVVEGEEEEQMDVTDLGDNHPKFRYLL